MLQGAGKAVRSEWFVAVLGFASLGPAARAHGISYAVPGDFATIQQALNAAVAGDSITVSGGPYNEKVSFPMSGNPGQNSSSLFSNPQFTDAPNEDYHLAGASPAINAGDPGFLAGAGELDIDGAARINGGRVDAGADEAGSCGNGTMEPGEACDDGDLVDCDGCDSNCTVSACGNGIVCAPEQCDDGNTASGDCCSTTCMLEAGGAPCNDGNLCTGSDSCDGAGGCVGMTAPEPVCTLPVQARKALLLLKDKPNDKSDRVLWKWRKGAGTPIAAFGDPLAATAYALCATVAAGEQPTALPRPRISPISSRTRVTDTRSAPRAVACVPVSTLGGDARPGNALDTSGPT